MKTTTTQHTPGPWTPKETSGGGISIEASVNIGREAMGCDDITPVGGVAGVLQPIYETTITPQLRVNPNGGVTAVLFYESWRQFPSVDFQQMQRANARLIAAAPELLTAVQAALDHFQNFTGGSLDECQAAEAKLVAILEDAELKATDGAQ